MEEKYCDLIRHNNSIFFGGGGGGEGKLKFGIKD